LDCLNPCFSLRIQKAKLNADKVSVSIGRTSEKKSFESVSINYKSLRSAQPVKVVLITAGAEKQHRHLSWLPAELFEFILTSYRKG